jgi:hypothetical protein
MSNYKTPIKFAIAFLALALLLLVGFVLTTSQPNAKNETSSSSAVDAESAFNKLRQAVDATVAKLGTTGWTEINKSTKEVIVFDPSSKLDFQIASYTPKSSYKPSVLGSVRIGPFDLMSKLEEATSDYIVYETESGYGIKYVDVTENGTSVTEYEIQDGVLISATVRDRIGKKNELNVVTLYFYGLDEEGLEALNYANNHLPEGGHD